MQAARGSVVARARLPPLSSASQNLLMPSSSSSTTNNFNSNKIINNNRLTTPSNDANPAGQLVSRILQVKVVILLQIN